MAIAFAPKLTIQGFDKFANPKWQMVPVEGERILTISGHGKLVVRTDTTIVQAVQTATGKTTVLTLTGGKNPGKTFVEWVPAAGFIGPVDNGFKLEVSVKAVKEINTAFHYVDDGKKQVTKRKIADLDALVAATNAILTPQANVKVKRKSAAALPMAQNLGDVVRFAAHLTGAPDNVPAAQDEWDDLKAQRDLTADFNVFFVKEYEQDKTPYTDNVEAGTIALDKMCVFEDNLGHSVSVTFAHETVHVLGVSGHSASKAYLMATGANGLGRLINRIQSNTINPSGT